MLKISPAIIMPIQKFVNPDVDLKRGEKIYQFQKKIGIRKFTSSKNYVKFEELWKIYHKMLLELPKRTRIVFQML